MIHFKYFKFAILPKFPKLVKFIQFVEFQVLLEFNYFTQNFLTEMALHLEYKHHPQANFTLLSFTNSPL